MQEKEIESYLTREIKKMGGRCLKWVCPGHAGVPDRIVLLPGGRIWFVELKTETGRPTAIQRHWQRVLRDLGFKAMILSGPREVYAFLEMLRGLSDEI